jgi:transcriptional regulator with XRE-family HTH domain
VVQGRSSDFRRAWPALAEQLTRLRNDAGLSTRQLARQLGWSQGKIHKIEHALTRPEPEDVQAWAEATNAPADQIPRLLDLAERAKREAVMVRAARRAGLPVDLAELQRQTAEAEWQAGTIRVFAPVIIPGLLQTPDYARLVVAAGDPDNPTTPEAIALRIQRQTRLYDEGRRNEFVIGEAALRWRYGPAVVQVNQLRQLQTLTHLRAVFVGILPLDRETPVWHSIGFTLLEDRADEADPLVHLEALDTFVNIADAEDVTHYQQVFDGLRDLAVVGDEARALLARLTDELSHHPDSG